MVDRRRLLAAGGFGVLATVAHPVSFGLSPASAAAASTTWLGTKKVAFLPVHREVDVIPPNWEQQIDGRVHFDPIGGQDVSLRAFLRLCSYGRADIEGHILPRRAWPSLDVPLESFRDELEAPLRSQGFHAAFILTLGGPGAGSALPAGFWARAAMAEGVGVWAMEILHAITGYDDLYIFPEHLDVFDTMASSNGAHPSAFTKNVLGWLDSVAIVRQVGRVRTYHLHTLALAQPPPPGRVTAVRVDTVGDLRIESRQGVDQFDGRIPADRQGVIVYEVASPDLDPSPVYVTPKLLLRTYTGLTVNQSHVSPAGVDVRVQAAFGGGYTVRVLDPNQHLMKRSAEFATPPAAGAPGAVVINGMGVHNITFRDTSGRLHELWRDTAGATGTTNLTGNAGAPVAIGDPFGYVHQPTNTEILLYRGSGGVVHSLYWSTGAVGHDNLSGYAGAPAAAGDPVGYHIPFDDSHHVIYRSSDGRLHELFWLGVAPVRYGGNLTTLAKAPTAVGTPSAYADRSGGNVVVFRASDGRIRSLYWTDGAVGHDNLSGYAGTPNAAGDPCAYYTADNDVHQIAYVAGNGHVYELYWQGVSPVSGWDLSVSSGAPAATGMVSAYYYPSENTKHVIYRSSDGRLHELWWTPGGGIPAYGDLTAFAGAPLAASAPFGFVTTNPDTQHVVYRGTDNRIYEIAW